MDSINLNIKIPLIEKVATNVKEIISHIKLNDGVYFDKSKYDKEEILNNLQSNNVQKKIEAMKHILIAHVLKEDVSIFFFQVLNNISIDDLTLKKLIYNYLSLYADGNPDLTILTINSFKKDLNNNNYQIRAYALRSMCSIRSLDMINVIIDSLKIMSKDKSPYVRKASADVIPSIYHIDPDQFVLLRNVLIELIGDTQITVVSAAVASFCTLCLEAIPLNEELVQNEMKPQIWENGRSGENMVDGEDSLDGRDLLRLSEPNVEVPQGREQLRKCSNDNSQSKKERKIKDTSYDEIKKQSRNINGNEHFYNSLSFLHPHYYKLCKYLLLMHPFHQSYLIDLLLRYCKLFYKDPLKNNKIKLKGLMSFFNSSDSANNTEEKNQVDMNTSDYDFQSSLYKDENSTDAEKCRTGDLANGYGRGTKKSKPYHVPIRSNLVKYSYDEMDDDTFDEFQHYEVDIEIFIEKLLLLLSSCSYSIIIQAISALYHLTKFTFKDNIIKAIIACIIKSTTEKNDLVYEIFLKSVQSIIICLREEFCAYISFFYISCLDSNMKKSLKIDMLYILTNEHNRMIVLDELFHALFQPGNNEFIVKKLFKHITAISLADSLCLSKVMHYIMLMLNSDIKLYSYESILSLRKLLRQSERNHIVQITFFLIKIFFKINSYEVKISVLWTLAKYQNCIDHLLLFDMVRMLAKSFNSFEDPLKLQVLHFVFKVWIYQYACWFVNGGEVAEEEVAEEEVAEEEVAEEEVAEEEVAEEVAKEVMEEGNEGDSSLRGCRTDVHLPSQEETCQARKMKLSPMRDYRREENSVTATSIYLEQRRGDREKEGIKGIRRKRNNKRCSTSMTRHMEDFEKFEILCNESFRQGSQGDEHFDIQETSKFYATIMLRIKQLKKEKKEDLNWTMLKRNLFKEPVNNYTLPLCYLKCIFLDTGISDIPNISDMSDTVRLSREEMQKMYNSPFLESEREDEHEDIQIDLKNPIVLQLNTISSILNRKLPTYVDLPDFAENDLSKSAHITNKDKKKKKVTSISSKDIHMSFNANMINDHIFSNLDDFYRDDNAKLMEHQMRGLKSTQSTHKPTYTQSQETSKNLLNNKGTRILGEDDESDDEQNESSSKICDDMANAYIDELPTVENFRKINDQEINDIENFFFSDED
ncbi:AP-3 complex subunit beta [Plasmodium gonderi]|uniref:AP-3 complex subunit beta n=1 Tax=Plasmodium gonderi TaxID=77519 RepID=A0A1Y1JJR1_PLAGO|nr:AP-3 complex subunit beta [Plasmodium gonderi]GAW81888.1 AP-3 complex subunit beta [Plasmodium gonderi]